MENKIIQDRLALLRKKMHEKCIDYYMMPTADFHGSEYVNDYFKVREYFCNFTGSNGTLVVWQDGAGLWTDGRYFIQAERELEGTGVELFRMMEEGVPSIVDFLGEHMSDGQTLGFDGRVISAGDGSKYEKKFTDRGKKIDIIYTEDLAEGIWTDRPEFPTGKLKVIAEEISGRSVASKLGDVRAALGDADGLLLTKLDDLMWLFNIRGCDVAYNPVAMSYGYITLENAAIFLQEDVLDEEIRDYFAANEIEIRAYEDIVTYLEGLASGQKIMLDMRYCSYLLYRTIASGHVTVGADNPTEILKAVKNPTELANMRDIYLKDSVALTRFIYWLKTNIGRMDGALTEVDAADKLEEFRREIPEFMDLSFPTIAGYGSNAAMMHYEATPDNCAVLKPEGLLLVDSGGQYLGGTTDVTRTIALGSVSEEQKMHYTAVVNALMQLTHAKWIYGCTGRNLDILARQPIWNMGLDYKCGTGHGVGYILNVHEGPQNMRWRYSKEQKEAVIEAGMDITNEPGVYIEGSHGIRIENVMVAANDIKNEYGQFMHFETLTWVPIDFDAIDERCLTDTTRAMLYAYQQEVFDKIAPYLNEDERGWLQKETRADNAVM